MRKKLILEMNHDLEILSVDEQDVLNDSQEDLFMTFEGMWFSFPTPFRRGDILINRVISEKPFVLNDIHTWGSKEMLENGYSEEDGVVKKADRTVERLMKKGDTSDMNYSGSYIGEDVRNGFYIFSEIFWNYLYLERYAQPLKGEQRALAALASSLSRIGKSGLVKNYSAIRFTTILWKSSAEGTGNLLSRNISQKERNW